MTPRRVLLSFADGYAAAARALARSLREAGLLLRLDPWSGGGGAPSVQRLTRPLDDIDFMVPLLTPSDAAPTWLGPAWQDAVFEVAGERGIPVLPVLGAGSIDAVPDCLRALSFADLRGRDAPAELLRLLRTMHACFGDAGIQVPPVATLELASPLEAVDCPLLLELGPAWPVEPLQSEHIAMLVDGLFYELGVHCPALQQRTDPALPPWGLRVAVNGVPEIELQVPPGAVLVNDNVEQLSRRGIAAQAALNPATGAPAAWVDAQLASQLQQADDVIWQRDEYLLLVLSALVRNKAADLLGVAETQALVASVEPAFPQLVRQTLPQPVSPLVLTDVLRRLLAEGVGIRNLPNILTTLADWGRHEDDPRVLTERVRAGLRRQISHQLGRGQSTLLVLLLDPPLESLLRDAITHTATGSYLNLPADQLSTVVELIRAAAKSIPAEAQQPQILTTLDIRAAVRRLIAPSLPHLAVVSYHDLRPDIDIQPLARITLQGMERRQGVSLRDVPLWN